MSDPEFEKLVRNELARSDNYSSQIDVCLCLASDVTFNNSEKEYIAGADFWLGRRMMTSHANRISKETQVTPDLVVFKDSSVGYIAEYKAGLPKEKDHWAELIRQLEKYDDDLCEWPNISESFHHDLILVIPISINVAVKDYLEEANKTSNIFSRHFSAIAYARNDMSQTFYYFQKIYGDLSDDETNRAYRSGKSIPAIRVLPRYTVSFIDIEPPVPYTMQKVWESIGSFAEIMIDAEDKSMFSFSFSALLERMKRENKLESHDEYCPELPKADWIRKALAYLEKYNYLIKSSDDGLYYVKYKRYKNLNQPFDRFVRKYVQETCMKRQKRKKARQLTLL